MNRTFIKGFLLAGIVCLFALLSLQALAEEEDADLIYSVSLTGQELDDLLAPIALYPDPLLAQMLPASTYPTEIADAEAWVNSGGDVSRIDEWDWAESVRAIAHYPDILKMMAGNMDWTANLGDAFLNQPEDVADSIQRLRQRARGVGNLASNNEQSVLIEGDYIQIVPAQPQYIYVPQYDTSIIYVQAPAARISPFITFSIGLAIGSWLSMDFDWGHRHVIYHGWDRPGWVNHARPYVHVTNVYINRSRPSLHERWRHDPSHGDPARYLASRPSGPNADRHARTGEVRGRETVRPRPVEGMFGPRNDARTYSNRGRESRGIVIQQPIPSAPGVSRRPPVPTPHITERPRPVVPSAGQRPTLVVPQVGGSDRKPSGTVRESVQPARRPSVTFGGYRGADEARAQSLRGQTSRQSNERPRTSTSPVSRGSAPAGKDVSRDRQGR